MMTKEMSNMSNTEHQNTTYLHDAESVAEMGRLLAQDTLFTNAMGGVLPERTDLSALHHVLDIGCGPGGWAMRVAKQYPHLRVTGIDISPSMIAYAQVQAKREGVQNVTFAQMNALEPLSFPDASF